MSETSRAVGRFAGKIALVTGAGGGIGSAIVSRLTSEGATVCAVDRDTSALDALVVASQADGAAVIGLTCDQADEAEVSQLFNEVGQRYRRLDLCFANAGWGRFSQFLTLPTRQWQRHMDVNLTGTFLVVQQAAHLMSAAGGSIVVTSSSGAVQPPDLFSAYCVAKAGLNMLVRSTAPELGLYGIRINAVMPGVVDHGMARGLLDDAARAAIEAATPLARVAEPADIAAAACFLASDEAAFVTGTELLIDGGQTVHALPQWFAADAREGSDAGWATYSQRMATTT